MKHTSSWALRRVLKSLGRYLSLLLASLLPVSYTHLTLPTNCTV